MQQKLTKQTLSRYRQEFRRLQKEIDRLTSRCLFDDPLIQATPGEVYRTCGKKTCKCMQDKDKRHGPYLVIQVYRDGKQRQISLKKEQKDTWDKAKHYQFQIECLGKLKDSCKELQSLVAEVIEKRTEEFLK